MNSFSEVIKKFREIFDIAADVKDTEINKCIQEADKLDIKVALCGDTFFSVSSELGGGKGESDIPVGTDSDSLNNSYTIWKSSIKASAFPRSSSHRLFLL
jgi:hypothetical protein